MIKNGIIIDGEVYEAVPELTSKTCAGCALLGDDGRCRRRTHDGSVPCGAFNYNVLFRKTNAKIEIK